MSRASIKAGLIVLALAPFAPPVAADPLKASAIAKQMVGRWGIPDARPAATVHSCDGNAQVLRVEKDGTVTLGTDRSPELDKGIRIEMPVAGTGAEAAQVTLVEGTASRGPTPLHIVVSMPDADTMIMHLQLPGQTPLTYRRCALRAG